MGADTEVRGTTEGERTDASPRVAVLGPVLLDGAGLAPGLATDLLALLALDVARWWPVEVLTECLWPGVDADPAARRLRTLVSRVRALAPLAACGATIEGAQVGYRLRVAPEAIDVEQFRTAAIGGLAALQRGAVLEASEAFGRALALWRSAPAATVPDDAPIRAEVAALIDLQRAAQLGWCRAVLAGGDPVAALPSLAVATVEQRGRPEAWVLYARGLAQAGRPADALAALDEGRRALRHEAGLEPGDAFAELERALMGAGPLLGASATAGAEIDGRVGPGVPAAAWVVARDLLRRGVAGERHLLVLDAPTGSGATELLDAVVRAAQPWMRLVDPERDDGPGAMAAPTLVILDAAPPSAWRPLPGAGLLAVLVRRSPLPAADDDVQQVRAAIGSVATTRLRLGLVDDHELRAVVLEELRDAADAALVDRIVTASGGILGAARALASAAARGDRSALPAAVIDLVERRASGLPRSVRAAIGRLVRGGAFSLGELQGETGLRERAVIEVLERAQRDGLLRVTAGPRFEPVAPVVRAALVAGVRQRPERGAP